MKLSRSASLGAAVLAASLSTGVLAKHDANTAMIAARSHFFGFENVDQRTGEVDKEKVIISWFSVQSYAVAARGHVFLLDSYIYKVADTPNYVPTTVPELVDLHPEAIFIGHGHGDHADNAAYVSVKTGAKIYGAAEHCQAMQGDAARIFGSGTQVDCTSLTTLGSLPGAEVSTINQMRPQVCITTFKHLHSGPPPSGQPDPDYPPNPINPVRDPRVDELYPAKPPPALDTKTNALNGGPVSMLYLFSVGDFSFLWHDTNGPIKELAPQIIPMLASMPKVDVELGSLVSTGERINGVRDITMYIDLVKPKIFYGGHSDNFNIGASPYYHRALQREFAIFGMTDPPDVRGFHDPYDYLRFGLATFEWKNKAWSVVPAGKQSVRCP